MQQFGFDDLFFEEDTEIIEDEVPEVDEENEPITQQGDIWQLGNHYLMCGDSTSNDDVKRLMSAGTTTSAAVDLILTDPPYNVNYEGGSTDRMKIKNDNMSNDDFYLFLFKAFSNAFESLKLGGAFYCWYASKEIVNFHTAIENAGATVKQELIWVKNSLVVGRQDYQWKHEPCLYGWKEGASHNWYSDRKQTTVLLFDRPTKSELHPTMKPVELFAYIMSNSTQKGETVFDPFGGSGTTLIASDQLERNCRTMELDPRYCDVIVKRWETLTGGTAVRINRS